MPPVSATRSIWLGPSAPWSRRPRSRRRVTVFLRSIAIVSGPTPPGTGRQRAGDVGDAGMHVADDDRAAPIERFEPRRTGAEQPLDKLPILHGRRADVDDRRAGLDEVRA